MRIQEFSWLFIFFGILMVFYSCKLGPNYSRSVNNEPYSYRQDIADGESIANTPWWELFGDSTLTELIWTALENNNSLNASIARIKESRANMAIVRSDLYPRINYVVDGSSLANTEASGLTNDANGVVNISYTVDL